LRAIKKNNNKIWYDEHKDEYKKLKNEFVSFLEELRNEICTFDTAVKAGHKSDNQTVKVFRLHRDTRFSKDKTKYKTAISGLISAYVKDPLEPVYYFAIELGGNSFIAGGLRTPENDHLKSIREYIDVHYKKMQNILDDKKLKKRFPAGLSNEFKLKTSPQGYDIDHPAIDLLRYKNFTIGEKLYDSQLKDARIKGYLVKQCEALAPINSFLRLAVK
jgi:uncharacterized protein (TIGR02453 family)